MDEISDTEENQKHQHVDYLHDLEKEKEDGSRFDRPNRRDEEVLQG